MARLTPQSTQPERLNHYRARAKRVVDTYLLTHPVHEVEQALIDVFIQSWAVFKTAQDRVNQDGVVIERGGRLFKHPAISICEAQSDILKRTCNELGWSVRGRKSIGIDDDKELNPLDTLNE